MTFNTRLDFIFSWKTNLQPRLREEDQANHFYQLFVKKIEIKSEQWSIKIGTDIFSMISYRVYPVHTAAISQPLVQFWYSFSFFVWNFRKFYGLVFWFSRFSGKASENYFFKKSRQKIWIFSRSHIVCEYFLISFSELIERIKKMKSYEFQIFRLSRKSLVLHLIRNPDWLLQIYWAELIIMAIHLS